MDAITPNQGETRPRPVATAAGRLADDVGPLLQADWRLDDWLKDAGLAYAIPPELWNRRQQALIRAARAYGRVVRAPYEGGNDATPTPIPEVDREGHEAPAE